MPETVEEIAAREKAAQQRALQFNRANRTNPPPSPRTTPQSDLGTVLGDPGATWKFSGSGTGGALLVGPGGNMNGVGTAIKIESIHSVTNAQKCGQLMENFFQNAQGTPPFQAPRTQIYRSGDFNVAPQLKTDLLAKMDEVGNNPDLEKDRKRRLGSRKNDLNQVDSGDTAVLLMEFADGVQANRMSAEDKAALMRSEAFAQAFGRSMAPSMTLGLTDHAGVSDGGTDFKFNVSNFMYDKDKGTLTVIDYDSGIDNVDQSDPNSPIKIGKVNNDTPQKIQEMNDFLTEATQSPEHFQKAISKILDPNQNTPFTAAMKSFTEPGEDSFFSEGEEVHLEALSNEDKERFVANMLKGAVEGMEYVHQNQQVLENAVKQTHETVNGVDVPHFHSDQQLTALSQEVAKIRPDQLKANVQNCIDSMNNKRKQEVDSLLADLDKKEADLRQKLQAAQLKAEQIKEHPTAGQRLKSMVTDKTHSPLGHANQEVQKIQKQLDKVDELRTSALSRKDFMEQMDEQANLKPERPKVDAPHVNVGTALHQDDGQRPGWKKGGHSLRDTNPELDHTQEQRTGQQIGTKRQQGTQHTHV